VNTMSDSSWGSTAVISTAIGILSLLAGAIGTSLRAGFKVADVRGDIISKIEKDRLELREQLAEEHSDVMRQFGDSLTALRQQMNINDTTASKSISEAALWNRDNFVRKEDLKPIIETLNKSIEALSGRMDAGLAKIEAKIDKLQASS
jgi:hypothetical protein